MKVSCILTSYNRPRWVRDAIRSVSNQTHKNYELLIFDDSTIMDIRNIVNQFKLSSVYVEHTAVDAKRRISECRIGINCNSGIARATRDLLCFLCDDDYYYPTWFESAVKAFQDPTNAHKVICYGRLKYSTKVEVEFPKDGPGLFPGEVLKSPICRIDHNQIIHRRVIPPMRWPTLFGHTGSADAVYFNEFMARGELFYPIDADCCVKRSHKKSIQSSISELGTPAGELVRE